eukprot:GGOE01045075.1.p1 GENE.GGOE01045075.1~~GGOE01045075.1.p1  ORF type:complete len:488 (-),score=119.63 GGOE01045075.1:83-1546(-)
MHPRHCLAMLLAIGTLLMVLYGRMLRIDAEKDEGFGMTHRSGVTTERCRGPPADCALRWLIRQWIPPTSRAIVALLYGRVASGAMLAADLPANTTVVVAPLGNAVAEAVVVPLAPNVLVWSPPTEHKLRAFATSMNLLDVQVVLEMALLQAALSAWLLDALLAHLLPMARVTFIVLPCDESLGNVSEAVQQYLRTQRWQLGPRELSLRVTALHRLPGPPCATLWQIELQRMVRGVRHFWCFHNSVYKHKFDLTVTEGRDINLRYIRGGKRKNLTSIWRSNLNMAEVLGWGLSRPYRKLLFWDALRVPQFSDSVIQNWVLCCGAHMRRIDTNANRRMHGRSEYLGDLRQMLCLNDAEARTDFPQCPSCTSCLAFSFHGKRKPPLTCDDCYTCARRAVSSLLLPELLQEEVMDCDTSYFNRTTRLPYRPMYRPRVGRGEHRCYPYPTNDGDLTAAKHETDLPAMAVDSVGESEVILTESQTGVIDVSPP